MFQRFYSDITAGWMLIEGHIFKFVCVGFVAFLAFIVWDNNSPAAASTISDCRVTDAYSYRMTVRKFYLDTSCGTFRTTRETYGEVKIGETYDFTVHGTFIPTITL